MKKPEIYGMDFIACGVSPAANIALGLGGMLVGCNAVMIAA